MKNDRLFLNAQKFLWTTTPASQKGKCSEHKALLFFCAPFSLFNKSKRVRGFKSRYSSNVNQQKTTILTSRARNSHNKKRKIYNPVSFIRKSVSALVLACLTKAKSIQCKVTHSRQGWQATGECLSFLVRSDKY